MKKYLFSLATIGIISLLLFSCTGKDDTSNFRKSTPDDDEPSCMTMTKEQIEDNWVTEYTDPANPAEEKISVLKFYAYYNPETKGYNVSVQAFNNTDKPLGDLIDLNRGKGCNVNLPGLVTSKSYDTELSTLQMLDGKGELIEYFTKLIITPAYIELGGVYFLTLDMAVATENQIMQRGGTLPCPPCINCKPPCLDDCLPPCAPDPLDSTMRKTNPPTDKLPDSINSK